MEEVFDFGEDGGKRGAGISALTITNNGLKSSIPRTQSLQAWQSPTN